MILYCSILIFFLLQVGAGLLFKLGAVRPEHWHLGFILGNVCGITSIYFLMLVYRYLNPNIGEAICRGGYFILIQIAFVLVYQSRLNPVQWGGIVMIAGGILLVSLCRS